MNTLWILSDAAEVATKAAGIGGVDILLRLAQLGVSGLAIYILKLAHNLYQQANSEKDVKLIVAKQKGAKLYLGSSYGLVLICAAIEIIKLFGPNNTEGPVKARIGITGLLEEKYDLYGSPVISRAHGQKDFPVSAKNRPEEFSIGASDQINVNLGKMVVKYDELTAEQRKTKDELAQQKITVRGVVIPPSSSSEPTPIH
ncbi:MAG: hypothetical protein ABI600_02115 [Luteolibacter sp.]